MNSLWFFLRSSPRLRSHVFFFKLQIMRSRQQRNIFLRTAQGAASLSLLCLRFCLGIDLGRVTPMMKNSCSSLGIYLSCPVGCVFWLIWKFVENPLQQRWTGLKLDEFSSWFMAVRSTNQFFPNIFECGLRSPKVATTSAGMRHVKLWQMVCRNFGRSAGRLTGKLTWLVEVGWLLHSLWPELVSDTSFAIHDVIQHFQIYS